MFVLSAFRSAAVMAVVAVVCVVWFGGVGARPVRADVADPNHYLAGVCGALRATWPDNRAVNIVCHGHSVPAGYFATPNVETFNAYPHLFHRGLKDRFPYAVTNVIVTAIGGEASPSGADRFARDVLSLRPDVVTIDYSLNDRRVGLDAARVAWSAMIEQAQAADVKVILLTPTADTTADLDDPNDPLNQHAEQVRQLAAQYGVGLGDSLAAFKQYVRDGGRLPNIMAQANHPNRGGHDLVVPGLLRYFPAKPVRRRQEQSPQP